MKKVQLLVAVLAIVLGLYSGLQAQSSATATADAKAKVIRRIKITETQHLVYGVVVPGATDGYITQNIYGIGSTAIVNGDPYPHTPTTGPGGTMFVESPVIEEPATFLVEGEQGAFFTITLPPVTTITDPFHPIGPGLPLLQLDQFHTNQPGSYLPVFGAADNSGTGAGGVAQIIPFPNPGYGAKYFAVGARLKVPFNAPPGDYIGSFDVTVAYN